MINRAPGTFKNEGLCNHEILYKNRTSLYLNMAVTEARVCLNFLAHQIPKWNTSLLCLLQILPRVYINSYWCYCLFWWTVAYTQGLYKFILVLFLILMDYIERAYFQTSYIYFSWKILVQAMCSVWPHDTIMKVGCCQATYILFKTIWYAYFGFWFVFVFRLS